MKETNIDSMKYRKSTHLAAIDVEAIMAEKGKCILTIKEAYYDTNVDVSGKKIAGYFLEFEENVKPMAVNSTNRKTISLILKAIRKCDNTYARNIGNWIGMKIELYFDETVKMKGEVVGGIRVVPSYPLPVLEANTENFDKCKTAIEKSGFTIDQIRAKYQVSEEIEKLLLTK